MSKRYKCKQSKAGMTILILGWVGSQQRKLLETNVCIKSYFKMIKQEGRNNDPKCAHTKQLSKIHETKTSTT